MIDKFVRVNLDLISFLTFTRLKSRSGYGFDLSVSGQLVAAAIRPLD